MKVGGGGATKWSNDFKANVFANQFAVFAKQFAAVSGSNPKMFIIGSITIANELPA